MKLLYLLSLFLCLCGHLTAQQLPPVVSILEKRVSLSVTQVEMEKVLQILSQNYGIQFSYSSQVVPIHVQISVHFRDQPLEFVLKSIFEPRSISYSTIGNRIVLRKTRLPLEQTVRGLLIDQASKAPISGANVVVAGTDPALGATTDDAGHFRIEHVPVGRQVIRASHIGYETYILPAQLVGTGKEVVLSLEMTEAVTSINELLVASKRNRWEPVNEMAAVSARHLPISEAKRYATSLNDPARIVAGYAGVTGDDYLENALVIRGNSSRGLLWRLEGVEIPNPNHFAEEGSASGGVSVISGNVLASSDFLTGAFPAQYGNALSGVLDLRLRRGNNEKREYSIQLGTMGLDVTWEGPFRKGNQASYLINYRYSLFSLLKPVGFDAGNANTATRFQDLSFKLNFPTQRLGIFSLYGIGGVSGLSLDSALIQGYSRSNVGVLGLSHQYQINASTSVHTVLSLSGTGIRRNRSHHRLDTASSGSGENFGKSYVRWSSTIHKKLNARHFLEGGLTFSLLSYSFHDTGHSLQNPASPNNRMVFDDQGSAGLFQGYLSWRFKIRETLTLITGLHATHFDLNRRSVFEPRMGLTWQFRPQHSLHLGAGMHSRIEPLQYYFARFILPDQTKVQYNRNLDFTKARHFVLGYHYQIGRHLNLHAETYYQGLYNTAVREDSSSIFSSISVYEGFTSHPLVNQGTGSNYGLELSLEKSFASKYYVIWNGSVFRARYRTIDEAERNSPYNSSFTTNLLTGKEFQLGSQKGRHQLSMNARMVWSGGKRYIPIHLGESIAQEREVLNLKEAYQHQLDDYLRLDFQIAYRYNHPKFTGEWRIDVFNVTNQQKTVKFYYNPEKQHIDRLGQLGILPVVAYRMEF
jgi:hypothetical protein